MEIKKIHKQDPWGDYTNSVPIEDVKKVKSKDTGRFYILMLTTNSYEDLLSHPDVLVRGSPCLERSFDVDCIVKHHEDCIAEFDTHSMYMHTGTRRVLT